jgi:hypothetical protein
MTEADEMFEHVFFICQPLWVHLKCAAGVILGMLQEEMKLEDPWV